MDLKKVAAIFFEILKAGSRKKIVKD